MLVIRAEQMAVFEQTARRQFVEEMVAHSRDFAPPLCEIIGDGQLRLALRSAIERAQKYGFTYRGPVRLFIELMFLCGSAFDTDPQYPAIGEVLRAPDDQMERAQLIHAGSLEYMDKVSGPAAVNVHKALRDVLVMTRTPVEFSDDFAEDMLGHMRRIFPQKAEYVGETGLRVLIDEAVTESAEYGFDVARHMALLVVLKFSFGHCCTNDPLYPWIARTLKDDRIVSPRARAARLEKKATTWLEHVVARNERGPQT